MRTILIAAAACTGAMADETYSTFGNEWLVVSNIPYQGQTMIVPEDCPLLADVQFLAGADAPVPYLLAMFVWSAEDQLVDGPALFIAPGQLEPGDDPLQTHEVGVEFPAGERVALVIAFFPGDETAEYGAGVTLADTHQPGSHIATYDPGEGAWLFEEGDQYDLVFQATWSICAVDMYDDDILNIFDFLVFQEAYTSGDMAADFNADGVLNILDFVEFQQAFVQGC